MSLLFTSVPSKRLATSIDTSATSFQLTDILSWDGVTSLTASDFGSVAYGVFRNDNNSAIEFFSWDPATVASSSITILKRGLKFTGDVTTQVTANKLSWTKNQTIVELGANPSQLYQWLKEYIDTAAIAGGVSATRSVQGITRLSETNETSRAKGILVSQRGTPGMTVTVQPFSIAFGTSAINYAGGTSGTMTAPVSNPRIDLIVYNITGAALAIRTGTEAASPSEPTPTDQDIVLASVYHRVGATTITDVDGTTNSYIKRWYEPAVYSTGVALTTASVFNQVDQSQTTQNSSTTVGEANATTKKNKLAQSFVSAHANIRGVTLYKAADTGSFTGTVTVALQADTTGSPSGSNLASATITNAEWLLMAAGAFDLPFTAEYASSPGTTYWIVITTSTSDNSNHPNVGHNTAGGYASGTVKYNNTTDGWVAVSTIDLYFKVLEGVLAQIPQTDATTGLVPSVVLPYAFVEMNNTQTSVSNSSAQTTVYTKLLPRGFFNATSGFRLRATMNTIVLTGETIIITIQLNGSTVATITKFNGGSSNLSGGGYFDCTMVNDGTGTSSQKSVLLFSAMTENQAVATSASVIASAVGTSAIDTSGTVTLKALVQMGGSNTSCSFTVDSVLLEKIG